MRWQRSSCAKAAYESWANTGRQIRGGTPDPFGAITRERSRVSQYLEIAAKQMLSAGVATFKTGLLALNPAYYLANLLTNHWQALAYNVAVKPMYHPSLANITHGVTGLFDRIPTYEPRSGKFLERYGMEMVPGAGLVKDIAGEEMQAVGFRENFQNIRDAGVRIAGPAGPQNYAAYRDRVGDWMLTPGERVAASVQQAVNLPRAVLGSVMKPFGSDIEQMFRASAFEKHVSTTIDRAFQDGIIGGAERAIERAMAPRAVRA
jgi:hypothetical protein